MIIKPSFKYLTLLALPLATLTTFASTAAAFEPEGKVECIAPSDPGGGWDFTCRSVGNVMQELDLVPANVQTINMAGAGGGVAFAHTVSKRAGESALYAMRPEFVRAGIGFTVVSGDMVDDTIVMRAAAIAQAATTAPSPGIVYVGRADYLTTA